MRLERLYIDAHRRAPPKPESICSVDDEREKGETLDDTNLRKNVPMRIIIIIIIQRPRYLYRSLLRYICCIIIFHNVNDASLDD